MTLGNNKDTTSLRTHGTREARGAGPGAKRRGNLANSAEIRYKLKNEIQKFNKRDAEAQRNSNFFTQKNSVPLRLCGEFALHLLTVDEVVEWRSKSVRDKMQKKKLRSCGAFRLIGLLNYGYGLPIVNV
jgi:hypothetical protein